MTERPARPFWLQPKWVVGHVLAVVLVVAFVNFGFWQLRRLDEKRTVNAVIQARSSLPVQPVDEVVDATTGPADVDHVVYRRVSARGTYDAEASVLVRSRSLDGRPGSHVLTPLVTGDGTALVVNRGFAPFTADPAEALAAAAPPTGQVEVTGLLSATQERQGIGPTDPRQGVLREMARVDLDRLQQQYRADLYPVSLQLEAQLPPPEPGGLPVVLPPPVQTEGNHLAYAVQWFVFAAIGAGGWPLLLRNTARERRAPPGASSCPPISVGSTAPQAGQATENGVEARAAP